MRQLGEDRDGEDLAGGQFRVRKLSDLVSEVSETLLHVKRTWVIDFVTHSSFLELSANLITSTVVYADRVLIPDMTSFGVFDRKGDMTLFRERSEYLSVPGGVRLASLMPGVEVTKLDL